MSVVGERVNDTLMDDLPNLKIEIENDLDQKMDTDEEASSGGKTGNVSSETEEGEVSDDDEEVNNLSLGKPNQAAILNAQTAVPTGRSILQYDTKVRLIYLNISYYTLAFLFLNHGNLV